ncbi:WD40 repeat-like protein [Marasmius fiardii PR-910]|nr:WD40 repeat-like protein [Marasmius fiardii PR-910]
MTIDSFSTSPPTTPVRRSMIQQDDEKTVLSSPSTSTFSLIAVDEASEQDFWTYNNSSRRPAFRSTPTLNYFSSPGSSSYSAYTHLSSYTSSPSSSGGGGLKTLFPRIWDVLVSSPTKNILHVSPTRNQRQRAHTIYGTFPRVKSKSPFSSNTLVPFPTMNPSSPPFTDPFSPDLPLNTEDHRSPIHRTSISSIHSFSSSSYTHINYSDLAPLDDEEGELIDVDDEACFPFPSSHSHAVGERHELAFTCKYDCKFACAHPMTWKALPKTSFSRARVVTGIDIVGLLPVELGLEILSYLTSTSGSGLEDILACASVSMTWRSLALDNSLWRKLFESRWGSGRVTQNKKKIKNSMRKEQKVGFYYRTKKLPPVPGQEINPADADEGLPSINYRQLLQECVELNRRWAGTAFTRRIVSVPPSSFTPPPQRTSSSRSSSSSSTFLPISVSSSTSSSAYNSAESSQSTLHLPLPGSYPHSRSPSPRRAHTPSLTPHYANGAPRGRRMEKGEEIYQYDKFEPSILKLEGHTDSVYCVELTHEGDFEREDFIFTGSRDRTIKMWDVANGQCVGTFRGHKGSVLCLKFFRLSDQTGVMYSGSSDRTIFVWDVWLDGNEARTKVRTVLRGHGGGVLDLAVNSRWVVSCSKDAAIRIWPRGSIYPDEFGYGPPPYLTLEGHDGPVNALGLDNGRVASASGDGKIILWDVETGERLRTFEGHERGLACIAFKDNIIVSGSSDCRIKVWSSETGDCLGTLEGHEALVRALWFDTTRAILVSASYDRSIRVWDVGDLVKGGGDVPQPRLLRDFRNVHMSHIFDVKFDYKRIISTSHDQKVMAIDFSKGLDTLGLLV